MQKYKAILFDKDGVLIDSIDMYLRAVNETLKHYGKKELSKKKFQKEFWGIRFDVNVRRVFKGLPESKIKEILEYYKKKRKEFEGLIKLYPSTISVLKALKGKYKLGIITSTFKDLTIKFLKDFELLKYFDIVVGGDEARPKPEPDPIIKACKILEVKPEDTLYVGDTMPDIKAGKAAGCTIVMVATSMTREELKDVEGILIIDDLKELKEILKIA